MNFEEKERYQAQMDALRAQVQSQDAAIRKMREMLRLCLVWAACISVVLFFR